MSSIYVPITDDLLREAIVRKDVVEGEEGRSGEKQYDHAVRGKIAEIAVEREVFEPMFDDWKEYEGKEHDHNVRVGTNIEKVEIKSRCSFELEKKGYTTDEADFAIRKRYGKLYAEKYVGAIIHGWDAVEIVGYATAADVTNADHADWTEFECKELSQDDMHPIQSWVDTRRTGATPTA